MNPRRAAIAWKARKGSVESTERRHSMAARILHEMTDLELLNEALPYVIDSIKEQWDRSQVRMAVVLKENPVPIVSGPGPVDPAQFAKVQEAANQRILLELSQCWQPTDDRIAALEQVLDQMKMRIQSLRAKGIMPGDFREKEFMQKMGYEFGLGQSEIKPL